ncbi:179_t:CDS:2 [Gigaspora margarita]|uniref:179_t:CDS:1 n=1 Tax=Gigaspora margarita TaxID=4874 RepID=A0ABN7UP79_GIGMA|nr:179_t:CDS:2 [Gigaspora margarita]
MYKLSSEINVENIFKNNLDNLSLLDNFNINNYIIGKISLGILYSAGKGVDMNKSFAFKLFLDIVEIGFNIGKYYVASCYLCIVIGMDKTKAFDLYSEAQFGLANCNANGICTSVNKNIAFDLYSKSINSGNINSIYESAKMLCGWYRYN